LRSLKPLFVSLFASLLLLAGTRSVQGQGFESLKCHKVKRAAPPLLGTLNVTAVEPDFSAQGCQIIGRAKELCTAVHVWGDQPPATGPSFTSVALDRDYNCYRVVCNGVPAQHEVVDRFGAGLEGFSRTQTICVPAVLDNCAGGACGSYATTCHESGQCACFTLSRGQRFCGVPVACADTFPCASQASNSACPTGYVCEVDTCCGGAVCVPVSTLCVPGDPPPPLPPSGEPTTVGTVPTTATTTTTTTTTSTTSTTMPECTGLGSQCCGSGFCSPHCGVPGNPLVCGDQGVGSCFSDADCPPGTRCTDFFNGTCAAGGTCSTPQCP
jgi:hypothetical protein